MKRVYSEGDTIVIIDIAAYTGSGSGVSGVTKYESTMVGNETYAKPTTGMKTVAFLDSNGAARTFNPTGAYTAGYEICVINKGAYPITLDSTGIAKTVSFGETVSIYYNGTSWY